MACRWAANSITSTKEPCRRLSRLAALFSSFYLLQCFGAVHQIDLTDAVGVTLDTAHGNFDLTDILGCRLEMITQLAHPLAQPLHILQQGAHRDLDGMGL